MVPFQVRAASRRPNILLIVADDLGWGDVGAYGNKIVPTPNIDRLARQGVRLTNGYVTAAVCSPSRAGIMTGRYQARFGHDFNPGGRMTPVKSLPKTEVTVAERMRAAGYKTGLMGKWHLGTEKDYDPISRGFDEYFGFGNGSIYIVTPKPGDEIVTIPGEGVPAARERTLIRGREPDGEEGYLTDLITRESLSFLERHKDDPFFLMVTQHAPHVPLEATKQYIDRVKNIKDQPLRVYAAMIVALDDCVGALLAKLDEHKLTDNTFVAFLSDNGCPPYLPAGTCSNGPFSGFKRYQLEGGIRVPMILKYPGQLKAGTVYNAPVISLDLTATVLALGGADVAKPPALEGVNLMPFLTGKAKGQPHNRFFWRAGANHAIHEGDWKLWVVARPEGSFATFLFNLKTDPAEARNLATGRPDMVQRLKELYEAWNRDNVPLGYKGRISDVEVDGVVVRLTF